MPGESLCFTWHMWILLVRIVSSWNTQSYVYCFSCSCCDLIGLLICGQGFKKVTCHNTLINQSVINLFRWMSTLMESWLSQFQRWGLTRPLMRPRLPQLRMYQTQVSQSEASLYCHRVFKELREEQEEHARDVWEAPWGSVGFILMNIIPGHLVNVQGVTNVQGVHWTEG